MNKLHSGNILLTDIHNSTVISSWDDQPLEVVGGDKAKARSLLFLCSPYLQTVKCLLIYPNPESALNEEAGKLLLEQYQDYFSRAQMMTEIHARPSRTTLSGLRTDQSGSASSSGSSSSSSLGADSAAGGVAIGKKRAAEGLDRKKKDKKKALKRL